MHPIDRRQLACHMYSMLNSMRKVAVLLQVSHSTVHRWLHQPHRKIYSRSQANSKSQVVVPVLKACVAADPLITLAKMVDRVAQVLGIHVSKELVRTVLKREGFSRKRARFYGQPADLPEKTAAFLALRDRYILEGRLFASIDETSFGRSGAVVKGYSRRGVPLRMERKPARMTTRSVLAVACSDGQFMFCQRTGSFNTATFAQFLRQLALPPGTVVLLDNVRFHHSADTRQAAADKGFDLLYVPPYSPWFNPSFLWSSGTTTSTTT